MEYLRKHYLIFIGVFLVCAIIGSTSLDLAINESIFVKYNGVSTFIGALGMTPGCGVLAFIGGVLINFLNKKNKTIVRIVLSVLSITLLFVSVYFNGEDLFGPNGYDIHSLVFVGYLVSVPLMTGFYVLGYFVSKNIKSEKLWIIIMILLAVLFVTLVVCLLGLKSFMHRPRYRIVVREGIVPFHSWFERFTGYKEIIDSYSNITKEEFKSFPSGHSTTCSALVLLMAYLPLLNIKTKKYHVYFMYAAFAYNIFVAFTRMHIGAHYLSDVSIGALIMFIFGFVFNELLIRNKKLSSIVKECSQ